MDRWGRLTDRAEWIEGARYRLPAKASGAAPRRFVCCRIGADGGMLLLEDGEDAPRWWTCWSGRFKPDAPARRRRTAMTPDGRRRFATDWITDKRLRCAVDDARRHMRRGMHPGPANAKAAREWGYDTTTVARLTGQAGGSVAGRRRAAEKAEQKRRNEGKA